MRDHDTTRFTLEECATTCQINENNIAELSMAVVQSPV